MIVQVYKRASEANIGRVVVAADDQAIIDAVVAAGGEAIMTRADHTNGSDRIHEAMEAIDPEAKHDVIINVQGDLPTIDVQSIQAACKILEKGDVDISTIAVEIVEEVEKTNPNVVKVVGAPLGDGNLKALYFTRATAPYGEGPLYHHVGLYGYKRDALTRYVSLSPSTLETRESLEQLRALEAGMTIEVAIVDTIPLGVDTPADLEKARVLLAS